MLFHISPAVPRVALVTGGAGRVMRAIDACAANRSAFLARAAEKALLEN